jgi:hypothetical protein
MAAYRAGALMGTGGLAQRQQRALPPLAQMKPQAIIDYLQTNAPPVYDPFSGGG